MQGCCGYLKVADCKFVVYQYPAITATHSSLLKKNFPFKLRFKTAKLANRFDSKVPIFILITQKVTTM